MKIPFVPALALAFIAAPLVAFALEPVRVVATGGRMATLTYTPPAGSPAYWQRTVHQLGGPVDEISIGFMNWFHSTSAEVANTNSVTIAHAWLERASTGQVVPLTFSGLRDVVLPASSAQAYTLSDAVPASAWTGAALARDEKIWLHVKGSIPAGGKICHGTPARYAGAKFVAYAPANDPGAHDVAGAVPAIGGGSLRNAGLPVAFLGRYAGPGHLAVIGVGDSILDGYSDTYASAPVSGTSPLGRAAVDANGANTIATMHLTRSGESAGTWVNHHARQEQLLAFANVLVEEFGTNDIGQNGSNANASTIANRLDTIWTVARGAGVQKIVRTRLLPRTQSASGYWLSKADQTPNPGWGPGGARDAVNASFVTALANGRIDALVDTLSAVADPTDDHYWLTNGTNDYTTGDGTHPFTYANTLLAAPLRAALLGLVVDDGATATEVTVDNGDGAPAFVASSGWAGSSGVSGYVGSNYLHDGDAGKGAKSALFTPPLTAGGSYAVSLRWTSHSNRATNVPVEIIHAGGSTPASVDQTADGGTWYPLGTYTLEPGSGHGVFIDNTGTDGHVVADAARFTPAQ